MINNIFNFVLGSVATAGTASTLSDINPDQFGSIEDLIKYIISIVGGILATIIINILKKKFPEWFASKNKSKNP